MNNSVSYSSRNDFIIENSNNDNELIKYDIKKSNSFMYISLNKTLEFKSGDGRIIKFSLIRTKINFNLLVEKNNSIINESMAGKLIDINMPYRKYEHINMAGELIDVSIPHRKDKSIYEVFDNLDKAISRYTLNNNNKVLKFNSYSLEFLIEDLEKILFHEQYPWDDKKYVKRLNRLCYLYFLDMFIKQSSNIMRKTQLQTVYKNLDTVINPVNSTKPPSNVSELNRLLWYYTYIKYKCQNKCDNDNFEAFKSNIKNNLIELLEGFENIDLYCKNDPGHIIEDDIYSSSIENLV